MPSDLYAEARAFGVRVWDAGEPEWSQKIDDVIAGGATATEILMGLRWTLNAMLKEATQLPDSLQSDARELINRINALIR